MAPRSRSRGVLKVNKLAAGAILGTFLPLSPLLPAHAGIDALDSATRAMTEKKAERTEETRDFNELSKSAKRRRGLAACKDGQLRSLAGYMTTSKCNNDVMDNNYQQITKALNGEISSPVKKGKVRR